MRVYVSIDLEGMPFIVSGKHLSVGKPLYEEARKIATEIVLTTVRSLRDEGVDEILVSDSHGPMVNIKVEDLPEYVELIRGFPRPTSMVIDIQDSGAAMFLGYHAKSNTPGASFDHTYSGATLHSVKINGIEVSEYLLNTYYAGHYEVPVILVAGDEKLLDEVKKYTPWAERIMFKKAYSRYSAKSPSLKMLKNKIEQSVKKAIIKLKNGDVKTLKTKYPVDLELTLKSTGFADIASLLPGSKRVNGITIKYMAKDIIEAYKVLELLALASAGVRSIISV